MKKIYHQYSLPAASNKLILKIKMPQYLQAPWFTSRQLLLQVLNSPSEEELQLKSDIAAVLKQEPPTRWLKYTQHKTLPVTIKASQSCVVSNGDALFMLESDDRELLTDVTDWLIASTVTQATIMALADIREYVRRLLTRAGEADPMTLSANSCVLACRNAEQEFAAALVFNQQPQTIDGILAVDSPVICGRSVIIASSVIGGADAAEQFGKVTKCEIPLWMTHTEKEFDSIFKHTNCIPVIPQHRDVTYIAKYINKKSTCGLKSINKTYAFYSINPFDLKQGFKNIIDIIGCCPLECIGLVDFACKPLMFDIVTNCNDVDTSKLVDINDIITFDHASCTKILKQLT